MTLRKSEWEVRRISIADAKAFIRQHHYSKGMSNTATHTHGLFRKGDHVLMGAAAWLPPTRVAAESVNKENWKRVLSLSRLAVHPEAPKMAATFLMAGSRRIIEKEQKWVSLVTYADTFMKHTGAIYIADNWTYVGISKPSPRWEDESGRQIARKSTISRNNAEMTALGYRMVGSFPKHKFVRHIYQRRKPLLKAKKDLFQ